MPLKQFHFQRFSVSHHACAHKVGTDGVLLGAWTEAQRPGRILDVGTGSGLIALMLAQRFPQAQITGIELDKDSATQACENANSSPFTMRLNIIEGDFITHPVDQDFDLIVSNPPFFKGAISSGNNQRDRARHEFSLPQKAFISKVVQLLSHQGKLAVILPPSEGQEFVRLCSFSGLYLHHITRVKGSPSAKVKRWLLEFSNTKPGTCKETELLIRNKDLHYSDQYLHLTKDFHLKLY